MVPSPTATPGCVDAGRSAWRTASATGPRWTWSLASAAEIAASIWATVGTELSLPTCLPLTNTVGVPFTPRLDAASVTPATRSLCWSLVTQVEKSALVMPACLPQSISCESGRPLLPSAGWLFCPSAFLPYRMSWNFWNASTLWSAAQ